MKALVVSNGHGEASIADRISAEMRALAPDARIDHLALVGDASSEGMNDVGPQHAMPSGGLIAMGNVANIARDVRSGLIGLTLAQHKFLRGARGTYDVVLAIGDVYALGMALAARAPVVFVGTAKSVNVAPYGPFEERVLRRARAVFVRDEATARRLREHGVSVDGASNVIVDLFATADDPRAQDVLDGFAPALVLFPGSRESAYGDGGFLLRVTRELAKKRAGLGAALSVARSLDVERFARDARGDGWTVRTTGNDVVPFELADGERVVVRAWRGALGPILRRVALVLGQAGTANEAAAAAGVGVVAFERAADRKSRWYRRRQRGLLGEALIVAPDRLDAAAAAVDALLADEARMAHMGAVGRERMGAPGGARSVAGCAVRVASRA
ncbi:MAG TPA: hypothetical protein VFE36_00865 [Candidatus Baltobacteraceae bacterium]|jgi:uncharacterized protein (TIGR03492 family)|nr:hypothetical protein [Candidatus Baltobacteraceae bacterium]